MHTLTAIDAKTGHSFPLVSLLAPVNHHDKDGSLFSDTGAIVTTPPSIKASLPENVDSASGKVFCNDSCRIAMIRVGFEKQVHEYKCGTAIGDRLDTSLPLFAIVDEPFWVLKNRNTQTALMGISREATIMTLFDD